MSFTDSSTEQFSLQQRYEAAPKQILVSGIQALVRMPIDLMRADRAKGWNTAAFISGYQGSPLGGYDRELMSQRALLDELNIVHVPGLNEELAATSVFGSQVAQTYARPKYDGVAAVWYGKSPGLDRAGDAIRHGSFGGTARKGGVVLLVGDDAAAKSSTLPSRSDPTLVALHLPVFYPGSVQEVLDLGAHAFAMSRLTGLWVAMKITTPVADGSGIAEVAPGRVDPVLPTFEVDGKPWEPTLSGNVGVPFANTLEIEVLGNRIEWAKRYVAANPLNTFIANPADAWLGIVAGGYDMQQVLEALRVLGLDAGRLADLGVRVLKLGALHPLDHGAIRELARGRGNRDGLRGQDRLPRVPRAVGPVRNRQRSGGDRQTRSRRQAADHPLRCADRRQPGRFAAPGAHTADSRRTARHGAPARAGADLARPRSRAHAVLLLRVSAQHRPARAGRIARRRRYRLSRHGQHRAPGARPVRSWASPRWAVKGLSGSAPRRSSRIDHFFQNMGDGTYFHSGQLAVQAAVASGTTMTFKILYNAAVAMTGGQDAAGLRSVPEMAQMLMAEGVKRITITTDDPAKYRGVHSARRCRRGAPRRDHRGASQAEHDRRRHRAHPRPAVRRRETSRPQAWRPRPGDVPGDDRRARLRGVR